jgi:hypothetical protein
MKFFLVAFTTLIATSSTSAAALTTTHICKNGSIQRRLEINVDETNKQAGCSVKYFKDTEAAGKETMIFRSDSHTPLCQERAEDFLRKLESWGYPCTPPAPAAATSAPQTAPQTAPQPASKAAAANVSTPPGAPKPEKKSKAVPAGKKPTNDIISDE